MLDFFKCVQMGLSHIKWIFLVSNEHFSYEMSSACIIWVPLVSNEFFSPNSILFHIKCISITQALQRKAYYCSYETDAPSAGVVVVSIESRFLLYSNELLSNQMDLSPLKYLFSEKMRKNGSISYIGWIVSYQMGPFSHIGWIASYQFGYFFAYRLNRFISNGSISTYRVNPSHIKWVYSRISGESSHIKCIFLCVA